MRRISDSKLALEIVHKYVQEEEAAARRFEAEYPGVDPEVLASVLMGIVFFFLNR